jgi:hypothetical protein
MFDEDHIKNILFNRLAGWAFLSLIAGKETKGASSL